MSLQFAAASSDKLVENTSSSVSLDKSAFPFALPTDTDNKCSLKCFVCCCCCCCDVIVLVVLDVSIQLNVCCCYCCYCVVVVDVIFINKAVVFRS